MYVPGEQQIPFNVAFSTLARVHKAHSCFHVVVRCHLVTGTSMVLMCALSVCCAGVGPEGCRPAGCQQSGGSVGPTWAAGRDQSELPEPSVQPDAAEGETVLHISRWLDQQRVTLRVL